MKRPIFALTAVVAICTSALLAVFALETSTCVPTLIRVHSPETFGAELEAACWGARRELDQPETTLADRYAYELVIHLLQYEDALASLPHPPSISGAYLIATQTGLTKSLEIWKLLEQQGLLSRVK